MLSVLALGAFAKPQNSFDSFDNFNQEVDDTLGPINVSFSFSLKVAISYHIYFGIKLHFIQYFSQILNTLTLTKFLMMINKPIWLTTKTEMVMWSPELTAMLIPMVP